MQHSAVLSTLIKLPVVMIFVLSIFELPPKTGFTVISIRNKKIKRVNPLELIHVVSNFTSDLIHDPVIVYCTYGHIGILCCDHYAVYARA